MAHIVTIGEGKNKRFKIVSEVKTPDGSRKRKSTTLPVGTLKSVAEELKRKIEYEAVVGDLGLMSAHSNATLQEFYENVYLPTYSIYLSPSTLKGYQSMWNNDRFYSVKNALGLAKLTQLRRKDVQNYVNTLVKQGLSPKTVRAYYFLLSAIMEKAVLNEYITSSKNPTKNIILPQKEYVERNAFTIEQASQLIEAARQKSLNDLLIVELGLLAGLRRSEISGLRLEDWDGDILHIRRAKLTIDHELITKSTKTKSGNRDIVIGAELQKTLAAVKEDYMRRKEEYGKKFVDSGFFLTNEDGKDKSPASVSIIYQRLIQSMPPDFPRYSLHCLRHTYTTILISNFGADIKSVSQMLGHSSVEMTLNTYTRSRFDNKRKAAENLDSIVKAPIG